MPNSKEILMHEVQLLKLELRDFRGFRFLAIDFESNTPITVLIADNGGGKTSVLDAIAGFLQHFLSEGILNIKYEPEAKTKDITNNEAASLCKIVLNLTYPFPSKELFEICRDVTQYLNDYDLPGSIGLVKLHLIEDQFNVEEWRLFTESSKDVNTRADLETNLVKSEKREEEDKGQPLPEEITLKLNDLLKSLDDSGNPKLKPEDVIEIAIKNDARWVPNMNISASRITKIKYSGNLEVNYTLNKSEGKFIPIKLKNSINIDDFIKELDQSTAFIEDFCESTQGYIYNDNHTVLPLMVYYGGSAINTKAKNISILYNPEMFQAYKNALVPERFDFSDFFAWFNTLAEEPAHIHNCVENAILKVLNAEQETYSNLRVVKGEMWIDKKNFNQIQGLPVGISQLSAGEKNIFALIGDLVKRAIQLNPLLFKVDFDPNIGSYSDPLLYTHGIVLIDEVDLHLHPKWQRKIIPILRGLFPKVQFLVTTHSPFVLQSLDKAHILSLPNKESWGGLSGWEIYEIIQDAMADIGDATSDRYQKEMKLFRDAILTDNPNQLEDSFQWLDRHLHQDNPKRSALEMQYNVFTKKGEYK